jgi:hypothetical protein
MLFEYRSSSGPRLVSTGPLERGINERARRRSRASGEPQHRGDEALRFLVEHRRIVEQQHDGVALAAPGAERARKHQRAAERGELAELAGCAELADLLRLPFSQGGVGDPPQGVAESARRHLKRIAEPAFHTRMKARVAGEGSHRARRRGFDQRVECLVQVAVIRTGEGRDQRGERVESLQAKRRRHERRRARA